MYNTHEASVLGMLQEETSLKLQAIDLAIKEIKENIHSLKTNIEYLKEQWINAGFDDTLSILSCFSYVEDLTEERNALLDIQARRKLLLNCSKLIKDK